MGGFVVEAIVCKLRDAQGYTIERDARKIEIFNTEL